MAEYAEIDSESRLLLSAEIEQLEIDLFLDAVYKQYGYDFRHYAKPSLHRRILNCLAREKKQHVSELIPCILHDEYFFDRFLQDMSVTVTSMFRDPKLFRLLKERVIPKLSTYSSINIWHAGCATGEEVYSLAILLEEAGLLDRCRIYATDYNNDSLKSARAAIYSLSNFYEYQTNYALCGGEKKLSHYYRTNKTSAIFSPTLRDKIIFAHHNFMKDGAFAQMHLVLCRNVLIYFDSSLKERALKVLNESIIPRGFFMMGDRESLECTNESDAFERVLEDVNSIYRKKLF